MKYKATVLAAMAALTLLLTACGDRMTLQGELAPSVQPTATTAPRVTMIPAATATPATDDSRTTKSSGKEDNMIADAEKDLEQATDKVKDELSDGDGIVR